MTRKGVQISLQPWELEILDKHAKRAGMPRSHYIKKLLIGAVETEADTNSEDERAPDPQHAAGREES